MSTVSDYTFNNLSRIGDDACDLSQRNMQDVSSANYLLTNYRSHIPITRAMEFATAQPAVNFTGSNQIGTGGSIVDDNSQILFTDLTRSKCKIDLLQRPFVTVPYLGRGKSNAILESQLQQGELANNRKSVNPSTEVSHMNYSQTPLIPSLKSTITNPANLVESVAAEGWIRGGVPVRQLTRDKEYVQSKQYL
jgi:hypothetical protein